MNKFIYRRFVSFKLENLCKGWFQKVLFKRLFELNVYSFLLFYILGIIFSNFWSHSRSIIIIPCITMVILFICNDRINEKEKEIEIDLENLFSSYILANYNPVKYDNFPEIYNIVEHGFMLKFFKCIRKSGMTFDTRNELKHFDSTNPKFTSTSHYIHFKIKLDSVFENFAKDRHKDRHKDRYKSFKRETPVRDNKFQEALSYFHLKKENLSKTIIREAFVSKVKLVHPDAGGSNSEFVKAKDYYDYLLSFI